MSQSLYCLLKKWCPKYAIFTVNINEPRIWVFFWGTIYLYQVLTRAKRQYEIITGGHLHVKTRHMKALPYCVQRNTNKPEENKKVLRNKKLLGAPGLTTRNKKLLVGRCFVAPRPHGSWATKEACSLGASGWERNCREVAHWESALQSRWESVVQLSATLICVGPKQDSHIRAWQHLAFPSKIQHWAAGNGLSINAPGQLQGMPKPCDHKKPYSTFWAASGLAKSYKCYRSNTIQSKKCTHHHASYFEKKNRIVIASRLEAIASRLEAIATRNKKLLVTSASLLVTSALLVVTRSY